MNDLALCAVITSVIYLIIFGIPILRVSVRHTQPDERVVYLNNSNMKVLGPGWVVANPFRGKLLLVSLREQTCQPFLDEKATVKMSISYHIAEVEKAVDASIRHGWLLLQRSKLPEKEKEKIWQQGSFVDGRVMANIHNLVIVLAVLNFKEAPEDHRRDVAQFKREIDEFCMARLQERLSERGIEITHVEVAPAV